MHDLVDWLSSPDGSAFVRAQTELIAVVTLILVAWLHRKVK